MAHEKKREHRASRNMRGFAEHRCVAADAAGKTGRAGRAGRAWRFYDLSCLYVDPDEPHFRALARTLALPTRHVRKVEEPSRTAHGRDF